MKKLKSLLFLTSFLCCASAWSGVIEVVNLLNTGTGSLRNSIAAATPGDTVVINVSGDIELDSPIIISNTSDITVIGPYPIHSTVTASTGWSGAQSLLDIQNCSNMVFENMGFVRLNGGNYRAIYMEGCAGTNRIDHCLFENLTIGSNGGAISVGNGNLDISNCSFIGNNGLNGGAIFIESAQFLVVNSTFANNTCSAEGGAMYFQDGFNATVSYNTFKGNDAGGEGECTSVAAGSTGSIVMMSNGGDGNGSSNQFQDPGPPHYISNGGNRIRTNGGETIIWLTAAGDLGTPGLDGKLHIPIVEDGYGLKYFTITDSTSGFVDAPNVLGVNANGLDCRRAPRHLSGFATCCGPNPVPLSDAGACEFTKLRVLNNSGDPNMQNSLPWCINRNYDLLNFIEFDAGPITILPDAAMTESQQPTIIDGYSQTGTVIPGPEDPFNQGVLGAEIDIEIENPGGLTHGFMFASNSSGSKIWGLRIVGFNNYGIAIQDVSNIHIQGNEIGITASDNEYPNASAGVAILGGLDNLVGGKSHWARNVITANGSVGFVSNIYIAGPTSGNMIFGNFIGALPNGMGAASSPPGSSVGITNRGTGNIIGGKGIVAGNLISGLPTTGILDQGADGTIIINNTIGLDYEGIVSMQNNIGVLIDNGTVNTRIGGLELDKTRNVISGNAINNILLRDCDNIEIFGNYVGLDVSGNNGPGGTPVGILLDSPNLSNIRIGTLGQPNSGNVISANINGVHIKNISGSVELYHNLIGTSWDGFNAVGNTSIGLWVEGVSNAVTIGAPSNGNTISASGDQGIYFDGGGTVAHFVQGNRIGTTVNGAGPLGNQKGIEINSCPGVIVGGDSGMGFGNIISANLTDGIEIHNGSDVVFVQGNIIGLDIAGTGAMPNLTQGIKVENSLDVTIGGTAGFGNVISAHNGPGDAGIFLDGTGATIISANRIGTNLNGDNGIGNETGIRVAGTHQASIGGGLSDENLISANSVAGIHVLSPNVAINGNFIGLGVNSENLGNGDGILIEAPFCTIGDLGGTYNNFISNNTHGIFLNGDIADDCTIDNCLIGFDLLSNPAGNTQNGIYIYQGDGNLIGSNFPCFIIGSGNAGVLIEDSSQDNKILNTTIGDVSGTAGAENFIGVYLINGPILNFVGTDIVNGNTIINCQNEGIRFENVSDNGIQGNYIGIDASNTSGSNDVGVRLVNSYFNLIGGNNVPGTATHNVVSYNTQEGIVLDNSSWNEIYGNFVGMTSNGSGIAPNNDGIVLFNGSSVNLIGNSSGSLDSSNVISGNADHGIIIDNADSNYVEYNLIGVDISGSVLGVQDIGIVITNGATENFIGGSHTLQGNQIRGNITAGLIIDGAHSNFVEGNEIGKGGGQAVGISIMGSNSYQNGIGDSPSIVFGNRIVDNTINGIEILNGATDNYVGQNYVGIEEFSNTNSALITQPVGVYIGPNAGLNNIIGLPIPDGRNFISGNLIGIHIDGASDQEVYKNFIGLDTSGLVAVPNVTDGILISNGAINNQIGGPGGDYINQIAGNAVGISIQDAGTSNNYIEGNNIGFNIIGNSAIPNINGVRISNNASDNYIGVPGALSGNLIGGNTSSGVVIDGASGNYVFNNSVGTNLPNLFGVSIENGSTNNYVGGTPAEGNIISGNDSIGVFINSASNNFMSSNFIGLEADGQTPLGNQIGVGLFGATDNYIGNAVLGEHNVISANSIAGIALDAGSDLNFISNNFLGTGASGNQVFGGTDNGIGIYITNCDQNTIGGHWPSEEGNVICYSALHGIWLEGATNTTITGNNIGLSKDNETYLGNTAFGINVSNGSDFTDIGATGAGYENVITDNQTGIYFIGSSDGTIENNFIGNDELGGTTVVDNGTNDQEYGVVLDAGSQDNYIIGLNVISGNSLLGVGIAGTGTTGNYVQGNHIGVDLNGSNPYPNDSANVFIGNGATYNYVGGTLSQGNVIGGDCLVDVILTGEGTDYNEVSGNYVNVGLNQTQTYTTGIAIAVMDSASFNTIGGGTFSDQGNYIPVAGSHAVYLGDKTAYSKVQGNIIGLYPGSLSPGSIGGTGVRIEGSDWNQIGGILVGSDSANVITNCQTGVDLLQVGLFNSSYGNAIIGNSIYENLALGIDINADGAIHPIDTNQTLGNNGDIDFPLILTAWNCGGSNNTHVGFEFYSNNALPGYRVEFYTNSVPDGSTYGEGETFLGDWVFNPATNVDTISIDLGVSLPVGTSITATITGTLLNTSEFSKNFEVTNPPAFNLPGTLDESCLGADNGEIYIDAPEAYYFSTDGGSSWFYAFQADTLYNQSPGSQTIMAQYLNGCVQSQNATLNPGTPLPFGQIMVPDTCGLGVGSLIFDTIPTNVFGGTGDYIYSFDGGTNFSGNIGLFGLNTSSFDMVMQDTTLGCYSDTINIQVTEINDVVDESFVYLDFCPGTTPAPVSWATNGGTWSFGPDLFDGATIDSGSGVITNPVVGNSYWIVYTVGQCMEDDTIQVMALPTEDPTFGYPNHCVGSSPSITTVTNGGTWSLLSGSGTIDAVTGVITGAPGFYDVQYVTPGQCADSTNMVIEVFAQPSAPAVLTTQTVYCPNEPLQAMTTSSGGSVTYNWYDDAALTTVVGTGTSFTPSALNIGDNYFYLNSVDGNGCVSMSDSANYHSVDVSGMYAATDISVCLGSTVQLEAFGGDTYAWNYSDQMIDGQDIPNPTAGIAVAEDFIVTITDTNGCVVVDTMSITLIPQDSCHIDVYNAFSPNDDGINDFWVIDGIEGFDQNTVIIFNRWGDQINFFTDYDNSQVVWDGTNKGGTKVPSGTYFYVVEADGARHQAGWVQVMK